MSARVLGLGAPVGDDAVGHAVVREVARRGVPPGVLVRELGDPSQLVSELETCELAVVVDAAASAGPPGRVLRLSPGDLARSEARPLSSHGVDVGQAIALARLLGPRAGRVEVVAVTIGKPGPLRDLSPEVARAVPVAADLVRAILSGA